MFIGDIILFSLFGTLLLWFVPSVIITILGLAEVMPEKYEDPDVGFFMVYTPIQIS